MLGWCTEGSNRKRYVIKLMTFWNAPIYRFQNDKGDSGSPYRPASHGHILQGMNDLSPELGHFNVSVAFNALSGKV